MADDPRYWEILCKTLDDGRIRYWCSTPVERSEDGWGHFYCRTSVVVEAGTSFDDAAAQSQAFALSDEELGSRRYDEHLDFCGPDRRRAFAHNNYYFDDGSEATGVVLHPKGDG